MDSAATNKILKTIALVSICFAIVHILYQMGHNNWPTGDEHWHYSYSERLLDKSLTERASVHNYNSTTPATVLNVICQNTYTKLTGDRSFSKFFARLPQLLWFSLLLFSAYLIAKHNASITAAYIVVILISLDANLQAHSTLIGTDLQFAAATMLVLFTSLNYFKNPSIKNSVIVGLTTGIAFVAKYSASFLVAPIILIFYATQIKKKAWLNVLVRTPIHLLLVGLCTVIVINSSYGFIGVGDTFADREWYYKLFVTLKETIPNIALPLPVDFISGFDHQLAAERTWDWNGIILGRELKSGAWYFFILSWLIKTPVAVLLLCVIGLIILIKNHRQFISNSTFNCTLLLFIVLLSYFSFIFRVHVGLRYALMCIPLAYLLLAIILSKVEFNKTKLVLTPILLVLYFVEFLPYFGNSLAFTNYIVWPKETVYQWIADSNIDWNQNHQLAKSEAERSIKTFAFNPPHIISGYNLITVNHLTGVYRNFSKHQWLRENLKPTQHFGFTTILFDISNDDFTKFLDQVRTFHEPDKAKQICHPEYQYNTLVNETLPILTGSWSDQKLYSACLNVKSTLVLEVKVNQGRAYIGSYPEEHNCQGTEAGRSESLWFKFMPGLHPVCAKVVEDAQANLIVHSGEAFKALRIFKK